MSCAVQSRKIDLLAFNKTAVSINDVNFSPMLFLRSQKITNANFTNSFIDFSLNATSSFISRAAFPRHYKDETVLFMVSPKIQGKFKLVLLKPTMILKNSSVTSSFSLDTSKHRAFKRKAESVTV